MSQFEKGSIKSLGKARKELLDTMRGLGDYKTLDDVKEVLRALNNEKLEILEDFLQSGGWATEIEKEALETLQVEIATRRGELSAVLMGAEEEENEEVDPDEYKGTPLTGSETVEEQKELASKPEPVVVAAAVSSMPERTRRTPRSPSKVHVARYAKRPKEGRRF